MESTENGRDLFGDLGKICGFEGDWKYSACNKNIEGLKQGAAFCGDFHRVRQGYLEKVKIQCEKNKRKKCDKLALFETQKLFPKLESFLVARARHAKSGRPGKIIQFRMLWESARFEMCFERRKDDYALNNNTQGLWARYLMEKYEDLKGCFKIRDKK